MNIQTCFTDLPLHGSPYHVYPINSHTPAVAFQAPNTASLYNVSTSPLLTNKLQKMVSYYIDCEPREWVTRSFTLIPSIIQADAEYMSIVIVQQQQQQQAASSKIIWNFSHEFTAHPHEGYMFSILLHECVYFLRFTRAQMLMNVYIGYLSNLDYFCFFFCLFVCLFVNVRYTYMNEFVCLIFCIYILFCTCEMVYVLSFSI